MHLELLSGFVKKIHKLQKQYSFINKGDKILVGVSGGKDSLLLLEIFGELKRKFNYSFEIVPIHIKITDVGYHIDFQSIEKICDYYGFTFIIKEISIEFDPNHKKGACYVCSWHRRKQLFSIARELKCNKIALGHHMDDAVQTLLMNMIYHGSISSMPAKLNMFQGEIELVRPLMFFSEDEIIEYKNLRKYPELIKDCPFGSETNRNTMKELIKSLESIHPGAKKNIFKAMGRIYSSYLPSGESSIVNGLNEIHPPKPKPL